MTLLCECYLLESYLMMKQVKICRHNSWNSIYGVNSDIRICYTKWFNSWPNTMMDRILFYWSRLVSCWNLYIFPMRWPLMCCDELSTAEDSLEPNGVTYISQAEMRIAWHGEGNTSDDVSKFGCKQFSLALVTNYQAWFCGSWTILRLIIISSHLITNWATLVRELGML